MRRHATLALALVALLCAAFTAPALAAAPTGHDAAKKTRAQKLKACKKKAKRHDPAPSWSAGADVGGGDATTTRTSSWPAPR